jgi:hypothetical protein
VLYSRQSGERVGRLLSVVEVIVVAGVRKTAAHLGGLKDVLFRQEKTDRYFGDDTQAACKEYTIWFSTSPAAERAGNL